MSLVRPEHPGDLAQINRVNALAFGQPDEAELVDRLRADGDALLSLVAVGEDGAVEGHILFSPLDLLLDDGAVLAAAALAPVAVLPDRQRRGIGGELVKAGIAACAARGLAAIVVVGHPAYYPRFGFAADLARGLRAPFSGEAFMALELVPGMLRGRTGAVRYAGAFGLPVIEEPA
jgi:putative acetyltransferase